MDGWEYWNGNPGIIYRLYDSGYHKMYEMRCHDEVENRRWNIDVYDHNINYPSLDNCAISSAKLLVEALNAAIELSIRLRGMDAES